MKPRLRTASLVLVLLAIALAGTGCPCTDSVVNSSPWLRWQIFALFGSGKLCDEMLKRGAPLRMSDGAPIIGRFYPATCHSQLNDDRRTVTVQFSGDGYAYTPITRKMSFFSQGVVEFQPDFHKDGSTLYVWFRPVGRPAPTFNIGHVEQPVVGLATSMTPLGTFVNLFGTQIMSSELGRGFTVFQDDGREDFSLGILQPPQRPTHPYEVRGGDRFVVANDTTEVQPNMLDFIGPIEVDSDRVLTLQIRSMRVPLDAAIVRRDMGEAWRRQFQTGNGVVPPPGQPIAWTTIPADVDIVRPIALPRGQYYIVLDNSSVVGQVAPPASLPMLTPVARASYLVWIADR